MSSLVRDGSLGFSLYIKKKKKYTQYLSISPTQTVEPVNSLNSLVWWIRYKNLRLRINAFRTVLYITKKNV